MIPYDVVQTNHLDHFSLHSFHMNIEEFLDALESNICSSAWLEPWHESLEVHEVYSSCIQD